MGVLGCEGGGDGCEWEWGGSWVRLSDVMFCDCRYDCVLSHGACKTDCGRL